MSKHPINACDLTAPAHIEQGCVFTCAGSRFSHWVIRAVNRAEGIYEVKPNSASEDAKQWRFVTSAPGLFQGITSTGLWVPEGNVLFQLSADDEPKVREYLSRDGGAQ